MTLTKGTSHGNGPMTIGPQAKEHTMCTINKKCDQQDLEDAQADLLEFVSCSKELRRRIRYDKMTLVPTSVAELAPDAPELSWQEVLQRARANGYRGFWRLGAYLMYDIECAVKRYEEEHPEEAAWFNKRTVHILSVFRGFTPNPNFPAEYRGTKFDLEGDFEMIIWPKEDEATFGRRVTIERATCTGYLPCALFLFGKVELPVGEP